MCLRVCVWMQLNNRLFEELAMDVYDEVDRRENDAGKTQLPICSYPNFPCFSFFPECSYGAVQRRGDGCIRVPGDAVIGV